MKAFSIFRAAAVALGSIALVGAAERGASACFPARPSPCKLDFAPAAGVTVPADVGSIGVSSLVYAELESVVRSVELLGPDGAPVPVTTEPRPGSITIRPQAPLAPGPHRIVAIAEQPSSCKDPAGLSGATVEPDAGTTPDTLLYRHESTFTVGTPPPLPTSAGTVTLGERQTLPGNVEDPISEYPVEVVVSPEMRPYLPVAHWSVTVDGRQRGGDTIGDAAPSFRLHVQCKSQAPVDSCGTPPLAPGAHKVRVLARLAAANAPIETNEIDVELSCGLPAGASPSTPESSSADGCNVTHRSSFGAGGGLALLGVAGLVAQLRRRWRRRH